MTPEDRRRVVSLCAIAALTMFGYATTRPAIESYFLEQLGSSNLPWAWLAAGGTTIALASAVSRAVARVEIARILAIGCVVSAVAVATLALVAHYVHPRVGAFLLHVWKDSYIVVVVELFWTFANVVFTRGMARSAYGAFGLCGSIGGIAGNLSVGGIASELGTLNASTAVIPMLLAVAVISTSLGLQAGSGVVAAKADLPPGLAGAWRLTRSSSVLGLMLVLVVCSQVSTSLIDLGFNTALAAEYRDPATRAGATGLVYAAVDASTIALNVLAPIVLRFGSGLILLSIPILLLAMLGAFSAWPSYALLAAAKIVAKSLDYSLFRAAKEVLYIALSREEKTVGKSLVDLVSYRAAKGLASFVALTLPVAAGVGALLSSGAFLLLWAATAATLWRRTSAVDPVSR